MELPIINDLGEMIDYEAEYERLRQRPPKRQFNSDEDDEIEKAGNETRPPQSEHEAVDRYFDELQAAENMWKEGYRIFIEGEIFNLPPGYWENSRNYLLRDEEFVLNE